MNHQDRLLSITEFIKPYQRIWQNEIMLMYPNHLDGYPLNWLKDLAQIRDKETLIDIEKKNVSKHLKNIELLAFYEQIESLSQFTPLQGSKELPFNHFTFLHMIPKKEYEIRHLAPIIFDLHQNIKSKKIVDIGGGIGLLAQTLSNEYHLNVVSFDLDEKMQETGKKRNLKNTKDPDHLVQYKNSFISEDSLDFMNELDTDTLSVGLHTCGHLANLQLKLTAQKKSKGLINFGCCYHKLEKHQNGQNISNFSKNNTNLVISKFGLTLASRAHRKMNDKDYNFKMKVKYYRYGLHILLYEKFGIREFMTLGNSNVSLYNEKFSTYANEQLSRIKLVSTMSNDEIDSFFKSDQVQKDIWDMLSAGILRNAFGRLLECYILLDRAIFLEEQGYSVEIREIFNEEISPRNLGIIAK